MDSAGLRSDGEEQQRGSRRDMKPEDGNVGEGKPSEARSYRHAGDDGFVAVELRLALLLGLVTQIPLCIAEESGVTCERALARGVQG